MINKYKTVHFYWKCVYWDEYTVISWAYRQSSALYFIFHRQSSKETSLHKIVDGKGEVCYRDVTQLFDILLNYLINSNVLSSMNLH